MKRKVIQIGNSTQLVSLPRKWACEHHIQKGDDIDVEMDDHKLVVLPTSRDDLQKREVTVEDEVHIKYLLHGLYKKGYDEVTLNLKNPKTISVIQSIIHKEMSGFEVVEQTTKSCVIKAIAGGFEKEFDTMLRRSFLLLKTIADKVLEGIQYKDSSVLTSLLFIENDINKYTCFCRRIINKTGSGEYKTLIYSFVDELERVADEYKYMVSYCTEKPDRMKLDNKVVELLAAVTKLVGDAYAVYYDFSTAKAIKLFMQRKKIISEAAACKDTIRGFTLLHYIINIAQKVQDMMRFKLEIEL